MEFQSWQQVMEKDAFPNLDLPCGIYSSNELYFIRWNKHFTSPYEEKVRQNQMIHCMYSAQDKWFKADNWNRQVNCPSVYRISGPIHTGIVQCSFKQGVSTVLQSDGKPPGLLFLTPHGLLLLLFPGRKKQCKCNCQVCNAWQCTPDDVWRDGTVLLCFSALMTREDANATEFETSTIGTLISLLTGWVWSVDW